MKLAIIGDIHGNFNQYKNICAILDMPTIALGDIGIGFPNINFPKMPCKDKIFPGNHDDRRAFVRYQDNYVGDYGAYQPDGAIKPIFFLGGGFSPDFKSRTHGFDFWDYEQLSLRELEHAQHIYETLKPDVVVTHERPFGLTESLLEEFRNSRPYLFYRERTTVFLERLLDIHIPKVWVYGHWHENRHDTYRGCEFYCVEQLGYKIIEV